jgi:hypothetical protein
LPLPCLRRQGVAIEGGAYIDTKGVGKQVYLFATNTQQPPYWDHWHLDVQSIQPSSAATGFAVVRSDPPVALPFHTYTLGMLGSLPADGKLLDSPMWDAVVRVQPAAPFQDGQLDYTGVS